MLVAFLIRVLSLYVFNTSAYTFHQACKVDEKMKWMTQMQTHCCCLAQQQQQCFVSLNLRLDLGRGTHWFCDICIAFVTFAWPVVFCRGWTQLARLHRTHYYTKDSACSCFHLESSVLTDTRRSSDISHKSAGLLLLIWKHGRADPIVVMNRIPGFRKDYFEC